MSEGNQLGELLVSRELLTREQLAAALEEQSRTRKSLGRVLIDQQLVTESDLVATLAAQIGLDFLDLSEFAIDPSAAGLITDALARRYQALPVAWDDGRLVVAMADPVTPTSGNGPKPKIRQGSRTRLIRLPSHNARMAIAALPAPRKIALIRNNSMITRLAPKMTLI